MKRFPRLFAAASVLCSLAAAGGARAATVDATRMMALAQSSGCLACHALHRTKVAPSYDAIAQRFQGHADAVQTLQNAILNGHSGTWGIVPMPSYGGAQGLLTPAQAQDLARWVLSMAQPGGAAARP
ncbi:c-type cytochrome [Thiomonas sp.]|jgi:cytochrome c|uniref:c-type cytochrome n=1 Tax=Thiomonas sp. TaxID=2047785 RepID=UPI00262D9C5D|nr:c-type cytochrome [Thiomonas sp.]